MLLSSFAGVFSRYFVVGFFLPVFFVLVLLAQLLDPASLPSAYREASGGTQLAILGGAAILGGLLLSGLNYHLIRLLEGYPLQRHVELADKGVLARALRWAAEKMTARWQRRYDDLVAHLSGPRSPQRTRAARDLNRYFPFSRETILPTRLGNTIRSFETHPTKRYGLEGVPAWMGIASLLVESEREALVEVQTDFAFFLNLTFLPWLGGAYLVVDLILHPPAPTIAELGLIAAVTAVSVVLSHAFYRATVGAAVRWGFAVRSAFDLHRLEFYEHLGLKRPRSDREEREVARAANRCILFGEPLDWTVRSQTATNRGSP